MPDPWDSSEGKTHFVGDDCIPPHVTVDPSHCADCGCSLEGTTPGREPWYTPDPNPTGPRLCGFCYADRMHRSVFGPQR
jgi:hypothetical protein